MNDRLHSTLFSEPLHRDRHCQPGCLKPTVVILGGGIRGAAIAALLSLTDAFTVHIVERHLAGSGTSSTNHGRLHSGTNLWRTPQADELSARRSKGSHLFRQLPGVVKTARLSLHCIEDARDLDPFLAFCNRHAIATWPINASRLDSDWVRTEQFAHFVEVAEHAFDPVEVIGRFLRLVSRRGGQVHTHTPVESLNRQGGHYAVRLGNGTILWADCVINAMGRWVNELEGDEPLPRLDIELHRWRLLFLRQHPAVPALDRVITIVDAAERERCPGAIPHASGVILGCRVGYECIAAPDDPQTDQLQPYDPDHPMDRTIRAVSARYFSFLRDLDGDVLANNIYAFAGIYPRTIGVRDSICKLYQDGDWPGYLIVFGGDATTALYDALDVTDHLFRSAAGVTRSQAELIDALITRLPEAAHPDTGRMVWDALASGPAVRSRQDLETLVS